MPAAAHAATTVHPEDIHGVDPSVPPLASAATAVDLLDILAGVVRLLFRGVREDLECLANLLELLFRLSPLLFLSGRVAIRVPLERHLAVGLLDLRVGGVLGHAEQFVEILAEALLEFELRLAQALGDGAIVRLHLLGLLVVSNRLFVLLELELRRGAAQQSLEMPGLNGKRGVAVVDAASVIAELEFCGRPVGEERQVQVHIVVVDRNRLCVRRDGLLVPPLLEGFVAARLGPLDLLELVTGGRGTGRCAAAASAPLLPPRRPLQVDLEPGGSSPAGNSL